MKRLTALVLVVGCSPQPTLITTAEQPQPLPTVTATPMPSASAARPPTEAWCAQADITLDLRAWPTNAHVDLRRESVYQAALFREQLLEGVDARVRVQSSGFVAQFRAPTEQEAFDRCAATVATYEPGAPTHHPFDHSTRIKCHRC